MSVISPQRQQGTILPLLAPRAGQKVRDSYIPPHVQKQTAQTRERDRRRRRSR